VGTNGKPDTKNIGIAFEISSISCLGVEKHAFQVVRPPYWFYTLPVWSHSILVGPNGKPDTKNIGIAFEISSISCLGVEKYAFQVVRPPFWFYTLPVWSHSILVGPNWKPVPENIGIVFEISLISCVGVGKHALQVYRPPYWFYPLPVWSHSILVGPNVQPVPENIGIVFEISLISCLGVEKHVFQVLRPLYWFFPLPVWSHSILVVSNR